MDRPYRQGPYTSYLQAGMGETLGDEVHTEAMLDEEEILENEIPNDSWEMTDEENIVDTMVDSWNMVDDSIYSLKNENNEISEPSYYYYYYYDESGIDISNELE